MSRAQLETDLEKKEAEFTRDYNNCKLVNCAHAREIHAVSLVRICEPLVQSATWTAPTNQNVPNARLFTRRSISVLVS